MGCSGRNWNKYNESPVDRIEYVNDLSFIKDYDILLNENNNKIGTPYKIPDALILYLARLRLLYNIPFRSLEGLLRSLSIITDIQAVSYIDIFRRIRKIKPELNPINNKLDCIIDSTEYKITIRGDYLRHKWHKKEMDGLNYMQ